MKDQLFVHRQQMDERNRRSRGLAREWNGSVLDATPLPGYSRRNWLANFQARSLTQVDEDRLEFRFDWKVKIGGLICLGAGLFILMPLLSFSRDDFANGIAWFLLIHVGCGVAFTLSGLYVLANMGAVRFDRAQGRMSVRRLVGATELDLARIGAVQLVSGGWHTADNDDYESFQLNLVVDSEQRRRNLLEHTEIDQLRKDGARLAEFLTVPFFDQTAQQVAG
jgi:hypothetical protein